MNAIMKKTHLVIPHNHGGPGNRIRLRNFIEHAVCSFQVAPFGIGRENGVPREGGLEGHFIEQAVSIGEGPSFGVKVEEIVHQEETEVKAMFDDSSMNGSSYERVSGFDCRLENTNVKIGMGISVNAWSFRHFSC